ncbi:MAG: MAPEG family protein [Terricaulis sp.]
MYEHGLLTPVVALAAWSLIMLIWLYATRIPAMSRAKIKPGDLKPGADLPTLPPWATNVADNYNHLMEQPTIFYAVALSLQLLGQTHPINITLAWIYVGLRVLHSLVQALGNIIILRFFIFVISSIVLAMLIFHAAIGVGLVQLNFSH